MSAPNGIGTKFKKVDNSKHDYGMAGSDYYQDMVYGLSIGEKDTYRGVEYECIVWRHFKIVEPKAIAGTYTTGYQVKQAVDQYIQENGL